MQDGMTVAVLDLVTDRLGPERIPLDRAERLPSGALRGWMVVATAGPLVYTAADPGGARVEIADEETLSDPGWLKSLKGVPVTVEHPGGGHVTVDSVRLHRVGTILGAEWDAAKQATIAEYVIDDPRGLTAIRGGIKGVSPGYVRERVVADSKAAVYDVPAYMQRARRADHVALTVAPRGASSYAQDSAMDPEQIKRIVTDALAGIPAAPTVEAIVDALRPVVVDAVKAEVAALKAEPVTDADAAKAAHAERVAYARLRVQADKLGVKAPEGKTLDDLDIPALQSACLDAAAVVADSRGRGLAPLRQPGQNAAVTSALPNLSKPIGG